MVSWGGAREWRRHNWRLDARHTGTAPRHRAVYGLCASDDDQIRYVGSTAYDPRGRLSHHLADARRGVMTPVQVWIRSVLARRARVLVVVLIEAGCYECERHEIRRRLAAGEPLLNVTCGQPYRTRTAHKGAA